MVKAVILGSTGIDFIKTPAGEIKGAMGGSGIYASFASSFFAKTGLITVHGDDYPEQNLEILRNHGIDTKGVQEVEGATFKWVGYYGDDLNDAKTISTELNSLLSFKPHVPDSFKSAEYIYLGNFDPKNQLKVLEQFENPKFVMADTMNFWIESERDIVMEMMHETDITLMNDLEAKQLFQKRNLVNISEEILKIGKSPVAIIKKGEHGSFLNYKNELFFAPAYPLKEVKDPTGCGDTYGGSIIGYLASVNNVSMNSLKKALYYGASIAAFNAESFSLAKLQSISSLDIENRIKEMEEYVSLAK